MDWTVIAIGSIIAGIMQTVTGFGAGVTLMMLLPYFFDMHASPALSGSITLFLAASLAWRYRKRLDRKTVLLPTVCYALASIITVRCTRSMDLRILAISFGAFLIILSLFYFFYSDRVHMRGSIIAAILCSVISGVFSGLFAIGGPLMAIYLLDATDDHESYIGSTQLLFAVTGVITLSARVLNGIYTVMLLPYTLVGIAGIYLGKYLGLKITGKFDEEKFKKIVYFCVGLSGIVTIMEQI